MRDIKVASRYAKSLLKIAIEDNALEFDNDVSNIHSTALSLTETDKFSSI